MKYLYPYILSLIFIISSCNFGVEYKIQRDYKKSLDFFDSSHVNHFPKSLPNFNNYSYSSNVLSREVIDKFAFSYRKLELRDKVSKDDYDIFKSGITNGGYIQIIHSDTNLLLLFSYADKTEFEGIMFKDLETSAKKKLVKHNIANANSLPIPLFEIDGFKGDTQYGLTDDFIVYVMGAEPGRYMEDKYLHDCECLPENWKHGYSKGVALSDKRQVIIYWVAVW